MDYSVIDFVLILFVKKINDAYDDDECFEE
jgi:hypothetical protein